MIHPMNTLSVNNDLLNVLNTWRTLNFGQCALSMKRFQVFDHEFWSSVSEHVHPFFEMLVVLNGRICYSIENHRVELEPHDGKALLIPPGVFHDRAHMVQDELIVIIQFALTPIDRSGMEILEDMRAELARTHCQIMLPQHFDFAGLLKLCETHPPLWQELFCGTFNLFILNLFSTRFGSLFGEKRIPRQKNELSSMRIRRIEQIIEITLDAHLRLNEYADRIGLSPRQVERLIRQYHQMPFANYLRMQRMEAAKKMLAAPFVSVKNIANSLGYDDLSYFCSVFRKTAGCTPGEYTERMRLNHDSTQDNVFFTTKGTK